MNLPKNSVRTTAATAFLFATVASSAVFAQAPAQSTDLVATPSYSASAVAAMSDHDSELVGTTYLLATNSNVTTLSPSVEKSALPDAPSALPEQQPATASYNKPGLTVQKPSMVVATGIPVEPLSARGKIALTFADTFSLESLVGVTISAGYSHVTNGQPNYGTNATAFGQRFGAAAARDTSEELFADAIFAPLLHQDPRYFREGSSHNFVHRVVYAATRTLVTRTDGGHETVNASLLLGYAGASALTTTYYPQINRNFKNEAASYGGSLGGEALYYLYSEFFDSAKDLFRLHIAQ